MDFFFYGTLCDADVRRQVLGRDMPAAHIENAVLAGFGAFFVAGAAYPTLVAREGGVTPGLLARHLGAADAARLAAFEGAAYCIRNLTVTGRRSGQTNARVFVTRVWRRSDARPWVLDDWQRRFKRGFLTSVQFQRR